MLHTPARLNGTLNLMGAFSFTDLIDQKPARRVLARIDVRSCEKGGRDLRGDVPYRPNHNFGSDDNRCFYVGQVELPLNGLRAGDSCVVHIIFLNGPGLSELLQVGRQWRIQEGPRWVASAEIIEMEQ